MKYLLFAILLTACGPASKLRRAEKLIKKAELQGAQWHVDTVYQEIPVVRTETRVDSLVIIRPGDSVVVFKDRLEVKIKRLRGDTVFVDAKCKADTVKISVPVTITKEIHAKSWLKWWYLPLIFLLGAIVGRFVIRLLI